MTAINKNKGAPINHTHRHKGAGGKSSKISHIKQGLNKLAVNSEYLKDLPKVTQPEHNFPEIRPKINKSTDTLTDDAKDSFLKEKPGCQTQLDALPATEEFDLSGMGVVPDMKLGKGCEFGNYRKKTGTTHHGIDISMPIGTPLKVPGDAVIISVHNSKADKKDTAGNFIIFACRNRCNELIYFRCAHLDSIPEDIKPGMTVKKGTVVAFSGNTGIRRVLTKKGYKKVAYPAHLHLEVFKEVEGKPKKNQYVNVLSNTAQKYLALAPRERNIIPTVYNERNPYMNHIRRIV